MSFLRKMLKTVLKADPITSKVVKAESKIPGSVGAGITALTAENVSSNPYKEGEASRHDIFAGGTELSKKEENRQLGRAVGTAAAIWFGAGAAGATSGTSATLAAQGASTVTSAAQASAAERDAARAAEESQRIMREGLARLRPKDPDPSARIDLARRRAEQQDIFRRRRGRRASILTGDEGVRFTPVGQRTLIGS